MQDQLHRIVYYSRNKIAGTPEIVGAQIRTILAQSQKNNAPIGITGALMFNAGCFAQVLEGKREMLESTFERIQQDARHGEVSLIAFEPISGRTFGDWSMGFVGARPGDAATYADIGQLSGFDPSHAAGDEIIEALKTLALEDEILA